MKSVSAVLLAAGKSSRFQGFKPLAVWKGETFLRKVFTSLNECSLIKEIIVVTGFQRELLSNEISSLSAREVFNPRHGEGMLGSIQQGLKSFTQSWDGALIAHVDQPQLEARDYLEIVSSYRKQKHPLLRPMFLERFGNPAIIGAGFLNEVLAEPITDRGCGFLFDRHISQVGFAKMTDDRCLRDYDYAE